MILARILQRMARAGRWATAAALAGALSFPVHSDEADLPPASQPWIELETAQIAHDFHNAGCIRFRSWSGQSLARDG